MWLDYYKELGDNEQYVKLCIHYVDVAQQQKKADNEERACAIDLKIELQEKEESTPGEETKDTEKAFKPLKDLLNNLKAEKEAKTTPVDLLKLYSFSSLTHLESLSSILQGMDLGDNHLYKNAKNGRYYLFLHKNQLSAINFNKICNILSEYGQQESCTAATEAYFAEHITCLIRNRALQTLATI